eukprot:jgi/Mesen1/3110/ME000184S02187
MLPVPLSAPQQCVPPTRGIPASAAAPAVVAPLGGGLKTERSSQLSEAPPAGQQQQQQGSRSRSWPTRPDDDAAAATCGRRAAMCQLAACTAAAGLFGRVEQAAAAAAAAAIEAGAEASAAEAEGATKGGRKLPKAYLRSAREVVSTMRQSLAEDPADDLKFRKAAAAASEAIKAFMGGWRNAPAVSSEESYVALYQALKVLGQFYGQKGPRAVMPENVKERVLAELERAEAAL